MKLYVTFSGGKTADHHAARVPYEGEVYKGEIVDRVECHDPPRNGYHAYIWLKRP